MLQPIVVMRKCATGVIRRIDEHAFHFAREFLFKCLQREQVVTKDQSIVKDVLVRHPVFGVVRLFRVFEQNARLQLGPLFLADPGEFEFLFAHQQGSSFSLAQAVPASMECGCQVWLIRPHSFLIGYGLQARSSLDGVQAQHQRHRMERRCLKTAVFVERLGALV